MRHIRTHVLIALALTVVALVGGGAGQAAVGDGVEAGPDGARVASFDPSPERPDTRFSEPAPGVAGALSLPVGESWARAVDLAASNCADADADPAAVPEPRIRAATLCLLNAERSNADLVPLAENAQLRKAARGHAADMVKRLYFSHESPSGSTFVDRIARARYATVGYRWTAGENLAWGAQGLGSPRLIVRDWMNSDEHRANILRAKYREIGIGIVLGAPAAGKQGATYATEYGSRTKVARKKTRKKRRRRR